MALILGVIILAALLAFCVWSYRQSASESMRLETSRRSHPAETQRPNE